MKAHQQINVIDEQEVDNLIKEFHIERSHSRKIDRIKYRTQINENNKFNWYHRPSLLDMRLEQRNKFEHKSRFDGESLYVWNIDGVPEFQVVNILNEMLMAASAYETLGLTNHEAAKNYCYRVHGSSKLWWEHYYTVENRETILNHKTKIKKTKILTSDIINPDTKQPPTLTRQVEIE